MIAYIVAAVSLLVSGASFYLNRTPTNTQFPRPVNLGAVFEENNEHICQVYWDLLLQHTSARVPTFYAVLGLDPEPLVKAEDKDVALAVHAALDRQLRPYYAAQVFRADTENRGRSWILGWRRAIGLRAGTVARCRHDILSEERVLIEVAGVLVDKNKRRTYDVYFLPVIQNAANHTAVAEKLRKHCAWNDVGRCGTDNDEEKDD